MKKARRVELYDSGILMGNGGIFDEFGQLEHFEVNSFELEKLAKIFDIPYGTYPEMFYSEKEEKQVVRQVGIGHLELGVNRRLRELESKPVEVFAEVLSAGLLELLLVYDDGYRYRVTYSGRFAVEWKEED